MTVFSKTGNKPVLSVVIALTVLAFVSRSYGVWIWDLVGNEYFTALPQAHSYTFTNNPAHYFLVNVSYQLFGQQEWISRIPALIIGIASIPIVYATWVRVVDQNAALLAAFVLVLSSWYLWFC